MKPDISARAVALAEYIIETNGTVRSAAKRFGISKSSVHKDGGVIIRIEGRMFEMGRFQWMHPRKVNCPEPLCQRLQK